MGRRLSRVEVDWEVRRGGEECVMVRMSWV